MPAAFPEITPLAALHALASPTAPTLLDVRLPEDQDGTRILGAVATPFDAIAQQVALCPNGAIVICHKGLKISAGVTARLRRRGVLAWRLRGGHLGWHGAGLPVTTDRAPDCIALPLDASAPEALAAWANLRFLAPRAELLPVARADLDGVTDRFHALAPTDLPRLTALDRMAQALDTVSLALDAAPPPDLFPTFDLAFRGALRHETVAQGAHAATLQEARP